MKTIDFSDNKKILLLIGLISIAVLILAVIWNDLNYSFFLGLLFDDAKEFAGNGTITSDFMPIGYSGFLGSCIRVGGVGGIPACQAFVYIGAIFLAFWFLKLGGARGILLVLGVLVVAFHPVLLLNNWRIHDGNLTAFLLLGFLAAGLSLLRFRNAWSALFLGIFAGLLFTVRVNTIFLIFPALLLFYNWSDEKKFKYLGKAMFFLAITVMVFTAVNLSIKQKPLFFPQHGYYNFFSGTNEYASRYLLKDFSGENSHEEALKARGFSSVITFEERLAFPPETYKKLALDYIKSHPIEYIKLAGLKFITLFRPGYHIVENFAWDSLEGVKRMLKIILSLPFFVWIFFVGKTKKGFFEKEDMFVFLVVILYLLPFLIANADPRYRFPLDIIFIIDSFRRTGGLPFFRKG